MLRPLLLSWSGGASNSKKKVRMAEFSAINFIGLRLLSVCFIGIVRVRKGRISLGLEI